MAREFPYSVATAIRVYLYTFTCWYGGNMLYVQVGWWQYRCSTCARCLSSHLPALCPSTVPPSPVSSPLPLATPNYKSPSSVRVITTRTCSFISWLYISLISSHLIWPYLNRPYFYAYDDDTRQLFQTFKMLFISEQKRVLTFLFSEWRFWRIKFFLYFFLGGSALLFFNVY